jgi:hypothetical protein
MALYVDGIYANGNNQALEDAIIGLRKHFKIKVVDDLTHYYNCKICFNKGKTKVWLGQPHSLNKNPEQKFGVLARSNQTYQTPGTPGKGVLWPQEGDKKYLFNNRACIAQEWECSYTW